MGTRPGEESFDQFLDISESLKREYTEDDAWTDSPFQWIKNRPSSQLGSVAEQLVAGWLSREGFTVDSSVGSDSDRLVDGHPVEIKSSTLWKKGIYKFQQIRDQQYDVLICLGLSPAEVHAWAFPKRLLMRLWEEGEIGSQHAGAAGSDTAWLTVTPSNPPSPEWVGEWGGALPEAKQSLQGLLGSLSD